MPQFRRLLLCVTGSFLAVLSLACGSDHDSKQPSGTVPSDLRVTLERQMCFGECPVYTVSVDSSGLVSFEGIRFVETTGRATAAVSDEQLVALVNAFQESDFLSLQDCYLLALFGGGDRCGEDTCSNWYWDAATVITSFHANGVLKEVVHYHGCEVTEQQQRLDQLETAIDETLDTCRWIGRDSYFCSTPARQSNSRFKPTAQQPPRTTRGSSARR
ncbi:MAG TPA: DUF6438 domain-containing protein [Candidatus Binatia bacterium]